MRGFPKHVMLFWIVMNLLMIPFGIAQEPVEQSGIEQSIAEESGAFGKIIPMQGEAPGAIVSFLPLYVLYLILLAVAFIAFPVKEGQVTLFIIMGLIFVFIFAFIVYLKFRVQYPYFRDQADQIINDFLEATSFKFYVQSCLDKATIDGLYLAGLQSGYIYEYQGGLHKYKMDTSDTQFCSVNPLGGCEYGDHVVPFVIDTGTYNVAYNITYAVERPRNMPGGYYIIQNETIQYPYLGSLVEEPAGYPLGYFGFSAQPAKQYAFPPLCDRKLFTPNYYLQDNSSYTCLQNEVYNTVQESLQRYIINKTKSCVEQATINFTEEYHYVINASFVDALVLFGDNDTLTFLNYSYSIQLRNDTPVATFQVYTSRQKVRYKELYELADQIARQEAKNIFFNMSDQNGMNQSLSTKCLEYPLISDIGFDRRRGTPTNCIKPGMRVIFTAPTMSACNASLHCEQATILNITDSESKLNGQDYSFLIAIENRPPALDWISWDINVSSFYNQYLILNYSGRSAQAIYNVPPTSNNAYNIILKDQGGTDHLEIYPFAVDPDEDTITYNYTSGVGGFGLPSGLRSEIDRDYTDRIDIEPSGDYDVKLEVRDPEGYHDYQNIKVLVEPASP